MAADNDEEKVYEDLKGFLASDRTDLRVAATEAILQVLDNVGMEKLVRRGFVSILAKNASYAQGPVATNSLKALVRLSSHGTSVNQCVADLLECGGLNRMAEIVLGKPEGDASSLSSWKENVNFAMSLLANLTRIEQGAVDVVGRSLPDEAVAATEAPIEKLPTKPLLALMMARFLEDQYVEEIDYDTLEGPEALDSSAADPYQHFAAVLMNSTQIEAGRAFVMKIHRKDKQDAEGTTVFQTLLHQLRSRNPLRRRGVAGVVRNCCLDTDSSWWFLNVANVTKHILYPLAGPEELDVDEKQGLDPDLWLEGPDKKREPDHSTRLLLVEAILLLLASGRRSREQLRLERAYVILKWADMVEEHEDVSEQINECVQFLRRDEEGTAEGSSDQLIADTYKKPSTSRQIGGDEDFDDVD